MTKKDYEAIAATMAHAKEWGLYRISADARSAHALLCMEMANTLRKENPRFDPPRFLAACGLSPETIASL